MAPNKKGGLGSSSAAEEKPNVKQLNPKSSQKSTRLRVMRLDIAKLLACPYPTRTWEQIKRGEPIPPERARYYESCWKEEWL